MSLQKRPLGRTGLAVTELCFGTLPMGPLQAGIPLEEGARLIVSALRAGVNFIDTAAMYGTYAHIRRALEIHPCEVVINSKSTAPSYDAMKADVEQSRNELGRYPDIFMLHAARATDPFSDRSGALECLKEYRSKGLIRAVGISTHVVPVALQAADCPDIDVVHPLINRMGLGLLGGTVDEMVAAIERLGRAGKGVYAMKALAGGNGLDHFEENLAFVRGLSGITSVAVGMVQESEVEMDVSVFSGRPVTEELRKRLTARRADKHLSILGYCQGCGRCVQACPNYAMQVVDGKAKPDPQKCLLCGYCSPVCPQFAIRMV